jgi:enamine deaminase RidA (YjgF/YER057c/UK114 family)
MPVTRRLVTIAMLCALFTSCAGDGDGMQSNQTASDSTVDVNQRLVDLGIALREPTAPVANYVTSVRSGNLIFLSGHGPDRPEGGQVIGKLGPNGLTVEQGQEAARLTGIALLSTLRAAIGDLNRVQRIVKVMGMVNAEPAFTQHPQVMNGFSDLMVEVFGDRGRHARSSVGMGSLPNDIAVEIDLVVEVSE